MKRNPCFCLVLFLSVLLSAHAGNPFAGNYGGSIFVTPNGSSEVVFTTAALLVDDAGGISGGLAGSVDNAGNITWTTPNTYNFTNGIVTNGVMTSVSASPSFSFRLAANFLGGNFVSGGTLLWRSPSTGGSYYNAVAYGNGRFVAVGYAGQTAVSTDGTNWGNVPMAKDRAELFDVAYGNGVFLAVGTNNPVLLSSNGISWTTNAVDNFSSVAFGGGKFLAVSPTGATFSSTDGVTWSAVAGAATAQNFIGVDYANGLFILFGSTGRFQTSADGVTWNTPRTNAVTSFTSAGYVGGRWVLGGSFVPNVVFTNVTGSDQVATNAGFSVRGLNSGSNLLVAATGASYPPAFSTNGLVWNYGNGAQDTLRAVAYGSNVFVAVGNYIQSSGDGRGWALRSAVTPVAMANNPGVNTNFGIYLDGATFNDALGRRRAVRAGQGGVIEMRFLDATNGSLDFVSVYSPTTNTLRRFLPASSPLVAVGDKGTLVRYDAANEAWRTFASPTAADLYDAHLNSGGNYVVVGSGGTILSAFAAQPTNLTVRVSGTADNLYSVSESSSSVVVGYRVLVCGDNAYACITGDIAGQ